MSSITKPDAKLAEIAASSKVRSWPTRLLPWTFWAVLLIGAVAGYGLFRNEQSASASSYITEPAKRGPLTVTVSATGKLQPTNQVDVGSELSGIMAEVLVKDNDRVKRGQVLARLDTTKLVAQVSKASATLASSRAKVKQSEATLAEARASLERLRQVAALSGGKVPSRAELVTAEAAMERAVADLASAQAVVQEASASLRSAETDVVKSSIRSPIDGIVLARKVESGQTVAASLQAPVLFTIAENLALMELQVNVDEADVGQVKEGQEAIFTVDAYPSRRFPARVTKVRYGSETVDGVVTYKTSLQVDNRDLSLRPGMTATAQITVLRKENALLVPNAALRFSPPGAAAPTPSAGLVSALLPRPPSEPAKKRESVDLRGPERFLWILREGKAQRLQVVTGASDKRYTEILSPELDAGVPIITDMRGTSG